ncbi:CHAT domain-containing protein [Annulohypoxylon nitens]|nr:CHAT domain-containing protein [Annulohypoxylon nitens]
MEGYQEQITINALEGEIQQMKSRGLNTEEERHKCRAAMQSLSTELQERHINEGEPGDLERAIEVNYKLLESSSIGDPDNPFWLHRLSSCLHQRLYESQDADTLSEALRFSEKSVTFTSTTDPQRFPRLYLLAQLRNLHWEQAQDLDSLTRAIDAWEEARHVIPNDHTQKFALLCTLRKLYKVRFERNMNPRDIDPIVELCSSLVDLVPPEDEKFSCGIHQLSQNLQLRFQHTNDLPSLDQAVREMERAVKETPANHHHAIIHLVAEGQLLEVRYDLKEEREDIDKAIDIAERVIRATSEGDPDRGHRLHQLGERLGLRFQRTGETSDLHRAIEENIKSITAIPEDDPDRSGPLNCLAIWLGRRFELENSMSDLIHAIDNARLAVGITHPGHRRHGMNSNTLANLLGYQYARTAELCVLDEAIEAAEAALKECSENSPERLCRLNGLSDHLNARYLIKKSQEDLNRAIEKSKISALSTPDGHTHLFAHLDGYSQRLESRFAKENRTDDLNEAIDVSLRALNAVPRDHYHAADIFASLGRLMKARYELLRKPDDYGNALSYFRQAWECKNTSASMRVKAASNAGDLLASQSNWIETAQFLQGAVELLPQVSPRSLDHIDKQFGLGEFAGLASRAAAIVLNTGRTPYEALRLLEIGRNMIAGYLLEMRTDVFGLKQVNGKLAEKFIRLRDELDAGFTSRPVELGDELSSWEARNRRRQRADQEFQEVIQKIREIPGFSNLGVPTAGEMQAEAIHGPLVVVNASPYRCDAFIIEQERIKLVKLENLKLGDAAINADKLRTKNLKPVMEVMEWSWDTIAEPILSALGLNQPIIDEKWRRMWWILTGPLTHLPIHAAGRYNQGDRLTGLTVLDRVISSYASSVKSILHDRRRSLQHAQESSGRNAVLLSMPKTPGEGELDSAETEIVEVERLCPSLKLNAVKPNPYKDDLLMHLKSCEIFHFAGHGISDSSEPSKSRLYLMDWQKNPLTVGDLREINLRATNPWLGYLSACSTGQIRAENLVDENIHLVNACQVAGFRHVVGTLWEVSDKWCVEAAKNFYGYLSQHGITDASIATALHVSVRALRGGVMGKRATTSNESSEFSGRVTSPPDDGLHLGNDQELILDNGHDEITADRDASRRLPETYGMSTHWIPYIHFGV